MIMYGQGMSQYTINYLFNQETICILGKCGGLNQKRVGPEIVK